MTLALVVAAVVGCGQPGPLYLPAPAASAPAKAASATPPAR
nr:lipoprotein [Aquabacterium terrae]